MHWLYTKREVTLYIMRTVRPVLSQGRQNVPWMDAHFVVLGWQCVQGATKCAVKGAHFVLGDKLCRGDKMCRNRVASVQCAIHNYTNVLHYFDQSCDTIMYVIWIMWHYFVCYKVMYSHEVVMTFWTSTVEFWGQVRLNRQCLVIIYAILSKTLQYLLSQILEKDDLLFYVVVCRLANLQYKIISKIVFSSLLQCF